MAQQKKAKKRICDRGNSMYNGINSINTCHYQELRVVQYGETTESDRRLKGVKTDSVARGWIMKNLRYRPTALSIFR